MVEASLAFGAFAPSPLSYVGGSTTSDSASLVLALLRHEYFIDVCVCARVHARCYRHWRQGSRKN